MIAYHVYMLSWDDLDGKRLLSVTKTQQQADALVDEYSEQFPHAYIDYERV
jgi:hypothetical protein